MPSVTVPSITEPTPSLLVNTTEPVVASLLSLSLSPMLSAISPDPPGSPVRGARPFSSTVSVTSPEFGTFGSPTTGGVLPMLIVSVVNDRSPSASLIVYVNTSSLPPAVPGVRV